ncbi:hypothetical protein [Thalassolituus sp.]|uniref:hypothetical protein n=1 Tax=Thalassolituus sp. TaxID=2030822 RepID=UPI00351160EE
MIGEWQPADAGGKPEATPTRELIGMLADAAEAPQNAPADIQQAARQCIQCAPELWTTAFEDIDDDALIKVAFFYIRAEQTLAGFESGASNPAIQVFRYLKSQGRKPSKETVKAMKAETDNRFIPHGDALS